MLATFGGGDWALVILAAFWAVLVVFLCIVLFRTASILESTRVLVDGIREETVPMLAEVRGSVQRANRELDRVDGMLESAGAIVARVEKISGLVEQATSSPLIKIISIGAGLKKAASKFSGKEK
jgi:uncharacterized protein YoxC